MLKPPSKTLQALKAQAEATFKVREAQKADAPVAAREYREAEYETQKKTDRLRAERLARNTKLSP